MNHTNNMELIIFLEKNNIRAFFFWNLCTFFFNVIQCALIKFCVQNFYFIEINKFMRNCTLLFVKISWWISHNWNVSKNCNTFLSLTSKWIKLKYYDINWYNAASLGSQFMFWGYDSLMFKYYIILVFVWDLCHF